MDLSTPRKAARIQKPNWAALPSDALSVIFQKVGALSVLCSAQAVCTSWWKLSLEPHIWRCIEIKDSDFLVFDDSLDSFDLDSFDFEKIVLTAVKRSKGQLVSLTIMNGFKIHDVLKVLAESWTELKAPEDSTDDYPYDTYNEEIDDCDEYTDNDGLTDCSSDSYSGWAYEYGDI